MLQLIEMIADFIGHIVSGVQILFSLIVDVYGMFYAAFAFAPPFLLPILIGMLVMAFLMWVVNIF